MGNGLITYRYDGLRKKLTTEDNYELYSLFKDEKEVQKNNSLLNNFVKSMMQKPVLIIYRDDSFQSRYRCDGDDIYFDQEIRRNYIDCIFLKDMIIGRKEDGLKLANSPTQSLDGILDIIPIDQKNEVFSSSNAKIHKYNFKSLEWNHCGNHRYEVHHYDPANAYLSIMKELNSSSELRLRRVKCPLPGTKYVKGKVDVKEDRF